MANLISIVGLLSLLCKWSQQIEDIPRFWSLPDPEIYADDLSGDIHIEIIVSPRNITLILGVLSIGSGGQSDDIKLLNFGASLSSFSSNSVRATVDSSFVSELRGREKWRFRIVNAQTVFDKSLHILARNELGTVMSRPFRIIRKFLNPFPLVHHEFAEFLMGNVGQVVCMIPHSRPAPPHIEFMHDNVSINITKEGRFKQVYLSSGAMILLIKSLVPQDSGSYTCTASLPGTKSFQKSDKITRLTVRVPNQSMKPRFRSSSHDLERGTIRRVIEVIEGANLTLYCLYESAPVAEVLWYWPNHNRRYKVDMQFGTLSITNVQKNDATDFTCSVDDIAGRTFSLRVLELPRFTSSPPEISFDNNVNKTIQIRCEIHDERYKKNTKWFHNGFVMNDNSGKIKISDNALYITALTEDYLGIYQCWPENDGSLWAFGVTVIKKDEQINYDLDSFSENKSLIERRTAPGLTIHLECNLDLFPPESLPEFTATWFRKGSVLAPLDLKSNKYVIFNKKSERKIILSIVNPTKNEDEGIYVCRLYSINHNLLRTVLFRLKIDDSKSTDPSLQESITRENSYSKRNLVSTPEVSKVDDHVPAVHLKWDLLVDNKTPVQIYHYRIQYQRKHLGKLSKKDVSDEQRKSEEWSEEKMIEEYVTANQITIVDRQIFRSQFEIRFRILAIPKVSSAMPSTVAKNETMFDTLSSDWSKSIDFKNVLNCKLSISTTKVMAPSVVEVMWTHTCLREPRWQTIAFHILYASITDCVKTNKCRRDANPKTYELILMLPEFRYLRHTIRIDREFGEFFQTNVTGLSPDTEFAIAIYGKLSSISQEVSFISLSNVLNVTTGKIKVSTNTKMSGNRPTSLLDTDDARNRVIFLVLGSLAGVLFVVAAVMLGMCVWYYMKKHMKTQKAQLKSSDPLRPALLFHYPHSSISSPLGYDTRNDRMISYQGPIPDNGAEFSIFESQKIAHPPSYTSGTKKRDIWPGTIFNHSPNKIDIAENFQSDQESDIDSICNSETMNQSKTRRNVLMGADQASSTYSRVGSERRLSVGPMQMFGGEYTTNFQNMTLPRRCKIPISFPEPPTDAHQDSFLTVFPHTSRSGIIPEVPADSGNENVCSVPFLPDSSFSSGGSEPQKANEHSTAGLNPKFESENSWMAGSYYEPYSSHSSTPIENNHLKSMLKTFS